MLSRQTGLRTLSFWAWFGFVTLSFSGVVAGQPKGSPTPGPPSTQGPPPRSSASVAPKASEPDPAWLKQYRSVVVLGRGEPLTEQPDASAPRRGTATRHARLPVTARARGPGCNLPWLKVAPSAWLCQDRVTPSSLPPSPARKATAHPGGLPYSYYFASSRGALGYRDLNLAEDGPPDVELQPGFAVAVRQTALRNGEPFGLTTKDLWVPLRDLIPARPSTFQGVRPKAGHLDFAWWLGDKLTVYKEPGGARVSTEQWAEQTAVSFSASRTQGGKRWLELGPSRWVSDRNLKIPEPAPPPPDLKGQEHWIDIDLSRQILIAYEGLVPVFATLISSGKGHTGTPEATPTGEYRIWVKLRSADMDNLEDPDARHYYAIQEVPWIMYFSKGYGIHGAFWHQAFGHVHSHGCVNASPLDAAWLFDWTSPRLAVGWAAALDATSEPGTRVRIR